MKEIDRAWDEVWEELDNSRHTRKRFEPFKARILAPDGRVLEVAMVETESGYRTIDFLNADEAVLK